MAPGETVVVIGCGGIGMAAINGAAIVGAGRIIAVDNNPVKLQLATKLGATDIVDVKNGDPVEQVKELTKGQVHHAIEAVGSKVTAEQAFQMLGPAGVATIMRSMARTEVPIRSAGSARTTTTASVRRREA